MRPVAAAVIAACLAVAACERTGPAGAPASEETPLPIKARQAMDAINADLGPINIATPVEGGVDQMEMEIEIHSLEGPWRWWDTARRIINNGENHVGQFEDLIYTVDPADLVAPVTLRESGEGRIDLHLVCRADPCIRAAGSYVEAAGTRAEVEAALEAPQPMDERLPEVYFPFTERAQAERVAAAMNDLLRLQGAGPSADASR